MNGTLSDVCKCGRWKRRTHCPSCGSYQLYAYSAKETVNRKGGHLDHVQGYRCKLCGNMFNADDLERGCDAPTANTDGRAPAKEKPGVVFKKLEDAPPELVERVKEIQQLKKEGKW